MPPPSHVAPSDKPGMGAVLMDGGCLFRVWAPNADAVTVGGDFFHAGKQELVEWQEIPLARDAGRPGLRILVRFCSRGRRRLAI
jgi:hypothetical protein